MEFKREKELLNLLKELEFSDILGMAAIVGTEIEKEQNFEDFITQLLVDYGKMPRKERREFLKLIRNVVGANREIKGHLEVKESQS